MGTGAIGDDFIVHVAASRTAFALRVEGGHRSRGEREKGDRCRVPWLLP